MKNYLNEKITLESLIKYIEGSAEETAVQTIDNWLETDLQNREFFQNIKTAWLNRDDIMELQKGNIDKDFENILHQIQSVQTNTIHKSLTGNKSMYLKILTRVAAVVIFLISIGTAYNIGKIRSLPNLTASQKKMVNNEIIVPKGQRSQVILSDGTKVWVNAGSKLRFPNQFENKVREVWLDGEGYFEVAKDSSKLFYVHTNDLDIKVHGTIFNLKAYSDEDIVETTLVEGLVSFETNNPSMKKGKEIYLEPNHKAIYLKKKSALVTEELKREVTEPLEPKKIIISEPVKVEPVISWTEGKLIFADESLGNIAIKLERRYDVIIYIKNDKIKDLRFTGVLKNVSIEQALNALQLVTGIKYTIKENVINISEN
jgi:ferric-dicitrate binding protein FerR (iron transport regulator)